MRNYLVIFLALVISVSNAYKLSNNDYFQSYIDSKQLYPDVLYAANRQVNPFEDLEDSLNFHKTLDTINQARSIVDSSEFNSDEFSDLDELNGYDDTEIRADPRDEESEFHGTLIGGHQYVSGGAGEGKQHLHPDGSVPNKEEVKTDEDLPAYCDPPNPCPVGYVGEDCDPRPYSEFNAQFSKNYQEQQNCMCDDDHNECKNSVSNKSDDKFANLIKNIQMSKSDDYFSAVVAKKSPRIRRSLDSQRSLKKLNPYLKGEAIKFHVAKKAAPL